jgi:hypothetical protein
MHAESDESRHELCINTVYKLCMYYKAGSVYTAFWVPKGPRRGVAEGRKEVSGGSKRGVLGPPGVEDPCTQRAPYLIAGITLGPLCMKDSTKNSTK